MNTIKHIWHSIVTQPSSWIHGCLHNRAQFAEEFDKETAGLGWEGIARRSTKMAQLIPLMFLIAYPPALIGRSILLWLSLVQEPNIWNLFFMTAVRTVLGIAVGIAVSIAKGF